MYLKPLKRLCFGKKWLLIIRAQQGEPKILVLWNEDFSFVPQGTISFDRRSTSFRATREHHFSFLRHKWTRLRFAQMKLRQAANDVMLRINDVALRANGTEHLSHIGAQFCTLTKKSLIFKDLFWFLGQKFKKLFCDNSLRPSGLKPSTILRLCHLLC